MASRDSMFWPIYIYLIASIVIASSAAFKVGWGTALSIAVASMLSLVAGGGLKASLRWGDRAQKIGGSVVALIIMGLAQWLATNFSVWLFGNFLSGDLWCWIGFAIGLIFTTKKLAEPLAARAPVDPAADLCFGSLGRVHDPMEKLTAAGFAQLRGEAEHNVRAQYALGGAYYNGNGTRRDPAEGARWLRRAAEQGYAPAQCDLGVMHSKGAGVEQDYQETVKWFLKAAEQGDALAQHNLGSLYAKGFTWKDLGFFNRTRHAFASATRDYVEAYKWFTLAAKNGHSRSLRDRAVIAKLRMKDYQIERAEQLIREFEREGMK
jgi:TPR repeat protein